MATDNSQTSEDKTLKATISNDSSEEEVFYFITNYKGEEVELTADRRSNKCHNKEHEELTVDYTDKDTKEIKSEKKNIKDKKLVLYYYDLFHSASEMASAGLEIGYDVGSAIGKTGGAFGESVGAMGGAAVGAAAGYVVGDVSDSLRVGYKFIGLPILTSRDVDYYYFTNLKYNSCCHESIAPNILIESYPDISYSVKVGFLNFEFSIDKKRSSNGGVNTSKWEDKSIKSANWEKTPWSFEIKIEYNDQTKSLKIDPDDDDEKKDDEKKDDKKKDDNGIIKSLKSLVKLLKDLYDTATTIASACREAGGVAGVLSGSGKAMTFTLSISPDFEMEWKYAVSDDLKRIGKEVVGKLSLEVKGELVIDIMIFVLKGLGVIAAGASVATGGLSVAIFKVIEFLVGFAKLLGDKSENFDFYFDLVVTPSITGELEVNYNSTSEQKWSDSKASLEVKLAFEIRLGVKVQGSMVIKVKINVKGGGKVSAKWTLYLESDEGYLCLRNKLNLGEASIYAEYESCYSFELWIPSKGVKNVEFGSKNKPIEKKFDGWDFGPWTIWKSKDKVFKTDGAKGKRIDGGTGW